MQSPRGVSRQTVWSAARVALTILSLVGTSLPIIASAGPKTFRQSTAKEFEEGETTGATILPVGEIIPGLVTTRVPTEAALVWCSVPSRDGGTVYFGTGDEGKIFAVPARGDTSPARRLATLDTPWVTALATRPDGSLVVATTPGGRLSVVDPRAGSVRPLASLGTGHAWTLARDDKAGVTYVGTGAPGKIFAVDDQGKARQVWDARDKHIVSLLRDNDGTLLAGTSEEAILYRVQTDGRAVAVQDFEAEEVRAIVRAPSGLFVAVNDFDRTVVSVVGPGPTAAKGTKIVLAAGGPPASAGALPRPGARKSKAAVYRIEADGRIEQVFALADGYLTALAVEEDGNILAAAGTQGHVYRINAADRLSSLVVDLPERQALTLVRTAGVTLVGTGDVGGVYRALPPAGAGGRYLSKVLDGEFPARWGTLRWIGAQVTFETRSGNTAKPDSGWHDWKTLEKPQADAAGGSGHIASPGARYLQYRATLPAATSRVRGVVNSYLPQNQRARVTELTVADAAASTTPTAGATATAVPSAPHSPILKLRWKTDNSDGDEIVYRLSFKLVGESVWRPLISGNTDSLTKPEYDWNTEGIPDGLYIVRVAVSDERSQPRDRALVSAFESAPLLVDNGRPAIEQFAAQFPNVTGRARDEVSPIAEIEAAIDGGEFQLVSPTDGIADELVEPFAFRLPPLAKGSHVVAIRVTDSAANVGAAQLTVKVP